MLFSFLPSESSILIIRLDLQEELADSKSVTVLPIAATSARKRTHEGVVRLSFYLFQHSLISSNLQERGSIQPAT